MTLDTSFIELNRTSRQRLSDLVNRFSDAELLHPIGQHWTVAIVLAHIAFWDRRVIGVLDMTERDGKLFIPQIDRSINDLSLPFWAAIPSRDAARIAVETAMTLDQRLEDFSPTLLTELLASDQRWVNRALHRNEHLDEVASALKY